jgi:hypothetical protein
MTMNSLDRLEAEVFIAADVSSEQQQEVIDSFRALGVATRARVVPSRRGLGEIQWLVLAMVPMQAFLGGIGSKLAEDAYQGLTRLVGRALGDQPKATPDKVLVLQDTTTRLQVVLEADLPAEAYQRLVTLDLSAIRRGPLHYDRHRGEWRSELNEWQQRGMEPPS